MDGLSPSSLGADDSFTELAQAGGKEPIGQVDTFKGEALILRATGETVRAEAGGAIFLGDTVETKGDGSIGLVFADGTTFSLASNGKMTIDELIYDPATAQGKSLFNVAQGVFTFVSGEIAKTGVDNMQVETPVATIGIRGTSGGGNIIIIPGSAPRAVFSNFRDPFTGQAGEMTISTPTGSQTLNGVNATSRVDNPFVPPSPPVRLPGAARELEARLRKIRDLQERTVLRSPVNGVVKTLHVTTVGGAIGAGSTVADVVPAGDRLVIEAKLPTQDIGYVNVGQKAHVSLASADAARFGRIEGEVVAISPDTIDTKDGIPYYKVRVETWEGHFQRGSVRYELVPGVRVMCSIRTG